MRNWLEKVSSLLGKFWTYLFDDHEFILRVENIAVSLLRTLEERYLVCAYGLSVLRNSYIASTLPVPILIDVNTVTSDYGIDSMLAGGTSGNTAYSAKMRRAVPVTYMISDHIQAGELMMLRGIDYKIEGTTFTCYTNPATLGLDTYKETVDGVLHVYYVLWGFKEAVEVVPGFATCVLGHSVAPFVKEAWCSHIKGLTKVRMKQILAEPAGAVVSAYAGTVTAGPTTENGRKYIVIDGCHVVSAPSSSTYSGPAVGNTVAEGDTVFGTLTVVAGGDSVSVLSGTVSIPIAVAPNIVVYAKNSQAEVTTYGGASILPVTADDATTLASYKTLVASYNSKPEYPKYEVPAAGSTVNPLDYLHSKLWRGKSIIVYVEKANCNTAKIQNALDFIREYIDAGTMLNVIYGETEYIYE